MKYLSILILLSSIILIGCEKDNEEVKATLENAVPRLQLTSMGLNSQVGPFNTTNVIRVTFGGAITGLEQGSFSFAWYSAPSGNATPVLVDSVFFPSWTTASSAATKNNSIQTNMVPTSYPNTVAYTGNLLLRLNTLPAGAPYTLRLYARAASGEMATVGVTRFVTMR